MIDFTKAKLEIDFWEGISSSVSINHNDINCWVKLKIMGISINEIELPPPVVFNEYLWIKVTSIDDEICHGILKTQIEHVDSWKAGNLFVPGAEVMFYKHQIHVVKKVN